MVVRERVGEGGRLESGMMGKGPGKPERQRTSVVRVIGITNTDVVRRSIRTLCEEMVPVHKTSQSGRANSSETDAINFDIGGGLEDQ